MNYEELKGIMNLLPESIELAGYIAEGRFFFKDYCLCAMYEKHKGKTNKNKWILSIEVNEIQFDIDAFINGKWMERIWGTETKKDMQHSVIEMIHKMKEWMIEW